MRTNFLPKVIGTRSTVCLFKGKQKYLIVKGKKRVQGMPNDLFYTKKYRKEMPV